MRKNMISTTILSISGLLKQRTFEHEIGCTLKRIQLRTLIFVCHFLAIRNIFLIKFIIVTERTIETRQITIMFSVKMIPQRAKNIFQSFCWTIIIIYNFVYNFLGAIFQIFEYACIDWSTAF